MDAVPSVVPASELEASDISSVIDVRGFGMLNGVGRQDVHTGEYVRGTRAGWKALLDAISVDRRRRSFMVRVVGQ